MTCEKCFKLSFEHKNDLILFSECFSKTTFMPEINIGMDTNNEQEKSVNICTKLEVIHK